MKHAIWILFIAAAFPVTSFADDAQQVPWANKFFSPRDPQPMVVHDFGTVPWGTKLTHRFAITNIYAVPMQITKDPTVGCGCTRVVQYTRKLAPRETGFVDIEMDGAKFQGAKEVKIWVDFGPTYRSTAVLQVRAFSRTDVALRPGQINFGVVALGQQPSHVVDVQYSGQQINWQITQVDTAGAPNVKVEFQRMNAARGVTSYRLTASLKSDANPGTMQDQIILKTNDAASPMLLIPVAGTIQSPLSIVQGNQILLDSVQVGQETVRSIIVQGSKPFKITKIEGEGEGLTAKFENVERPIQVVKISFIPTQAGLLKRKLVIHTDQKETVSTTVEGTAEAIKP
jgi:hypothetical protein